MVQQRTSSITAVVARTSRRDIANKHPHRTSCCTRDSALPRSFVLWMTGVETKPAHTFSKKNDEVTRTCIATPPSQGGSAQGGDRESKQQQCRLSTGERRDISPPLPPRYHFFFTCGVTARDCDFGSLFGSSNGAVLLPTLLRALTARRITRSNDFIACVSIDRKRNVPLANKPVVFAI